MDDGVSVQPVRWRLDSSARTVAHGTALLGGSPLRLLRLSPQGMAAVERVVGGAPAGSHAVEALLWRLADAGILEPLVAGSAPDSKLALVIPFHGADAAHHDQLADLVGVLGALAPVSPLVVVDDASPQPVRLETLCADREPGNPPTVLRHAANSGPAAARNTGWREARRLGADHVVFVDADVRPSDRSVEALHGWLTAQALGQPATAAVAPRICARPEDRLVARSEQIRSPLDLGTEPAPVHPRSRVSYVPSAMLGVGLEWLERVGGFDEDLRVGEDVDLIWRLCEAGGRVRYDPSIRVWHLSRTTLSAALRQRFSYGRSSGLLAQRHGSALAAIELPALTTAMWALVATQRRGTMLAAVAVGAADAAWVKRQLGARIGPAELAPAIARAQSSAVRWLLHACARPWLPLILVAGRRSRAARRIGVLALLARPVRDWIGGPRRIDLLRHAAVEGLGDIASSAGIWVGTVEQRTATPLMPRIRWPASRN